eukprot:gb/GFBE01051468.1/.p1 GENE.gb/GFBE01051468.1/~~gb/GFBE01051468.1/.p1  ORF type:complete len:243 (+),score=25.97 gb/GFBE01051468.1/:1-729(+)
MGVECFECGGDHFVRDCPEKSARASGKSKGKGKQVDAQPDRRQSKGKGNAKGGGKSNGKGDSGWRPDPPVETPGEWVQLAQFKGKKSFAYFRCQCGKSWTTAHGYAEYRQDCKSCDEACRPKLMWQNDERVRQGLVIPTREDNGIPHDSERCEACRLGKCSLRHGWRAESAAGGAPRDSGQRVRQEVMTPSVNPSAPPRPTSSAVTGRGINYGSAGDRDLERQRLQLAQRHPLRECCPCSLM